MFQTTILIAATLDAMREPKTREPTYAKARAAVIVAVALVVMLAPLAAWAATKAGVELPLWLDGRTAKYLSGSTADDAIPRDGGGLLTEFASGELQDALESKVLNNTPLRAQALLGSSGLQRSAIKTSNILFNWPAYPTYYGSSKAYCPSDSGLITIPPQSWNYEGLVSFGANLAQYAKDHPNQRIVMYIVSESNDKTMNPAAQLMSIPDWSRESELAIKRQVEGLTNVAVLRSSYPNLSEYYGDYFKSDHHWRAKGALSAANEIANCLDLKPVTSMGTQIIEGSYVGSNARNGLDIVIDELSDELVDYSNIEIVYNDEILSATDHLEFESLEYPDDKFSFYDKYFGSVDDRRFIGGDGGGDGLLVTDSYGQAIARPLSKLFKELFVTEALYYWDDDEDNLGQITSTNDINDIVFVGYLSDYKNFTERHPTFFLD